jgi:alpha-galactosidase
VYPVSDDRHYSEFTEDAMRKNHYFGKTLGLEAYSFEKTIEHGDQTYAGMKELAMSTEPLPDRFFDRVPGEHEQLMEIIDSIERDRKQLYSVNMPNNGAVPGLPAEAILELPAVAAGSGFKALQILDLPDILHKPLVKHIEIGEMTVEAALTGNKSLFVEAVLAGGYISDAAAAAKMVEELIHAQQAYLPQF